MNNKKISVIVPVYNAEKYIKRCAKSVLNQTYKNIELILINDGSKDESLKICQEIAETDERVLVFDKENGGAASARNVGIKNATGYYLGFCDADDYIESDMYETLLSIMEENDLKMIECTYNKVNEENDITEKGLDDRNLVVKSAQEAIEELFLWIGGASISTRVLEKSLFDNLEIPEGRRVEDFYASILLIDASGKNATYNYPFYNYLTNSKSVTKSGGAGIYLDALYFRNKAKNEIEDKYDLAESMEFFLFKCYYLFSVSVLKKEFKLYRKEIREMKNLLKAKKQDVINCRYLKKKERLTLQLASKSMHLTRSLYLLKNIIGKKK